MAEAASAYSIEPGLLQPAPRPVRLKPSRARSTKAKIIVVGATLVFACVSLSLVVDALISAAALSFGEEMPAVISGRHTSSSRAGLAHFLDYTYQAGGTARTGSGKVWQNTYDSIPQGTAVRVKVLSWLPGESSQLLLPEGHYVRRDIFSRFMGALVAGFAAAVIPYLVYLRPRRRRRLVVSGVPVQGRIIDVKTWGEKPDPANPDRNDWKKVPTVTCQYEYAPNVTQNKSGSAPPVVQTWTAVEDDKDRPPVQIGDAVTVLYDPQRPQRSVVYRFTEYEVVT